MHPTERFVISSDFSSFSSACDIEASSFVRTSIHSALIAATNTTSVACVSSKGKGKYDVSECYAKDNREGYSGDGFSCGRIRSIADVDPNVLGEVFIPEWNVPCESCFDTVVDCRWVLDWITPHKFFSELRIMGHKEFFEEFNYLTARQVSFCSEARSRAEHNIARKQKLSSFCGRQAGSARG